MPELPNTKHERFARAMARGMMARDAHAEAGYCPDGWRALRLAKRPEVAARIAELTESMAREAEFDRTAVVRRLMAIIDSKPSEAGSENPLCQERVTGGEVRYVFPDKLEAIEALGKIMGWSRADSRDKDKDKEAEHKPDRLELLMARIRKRK